MFLHSGDIDEISFTSDVQNQIIEILQHIGQGACSWCRGNMRLASISGEDAMVQNSWIQHY